MLDVGVGVVVRRALGELVGLHLLRGEGVELLLELGHLGGVLLNVVLVAGGLGALELARELLDLALQEVAGDLLPARTASTAFCYGRSRRARRAFEQRRRITRFATARRNEDAGPRSSSLSLIDPSELKNLRGESTTYGRRARSALYINEWPIPALSDFSFLTATHLLE